ncbi:nucleoside diphosphate kinase 3 isoform X1 [Hippoglossus hippoglossus]|uniref:nucleoside diphosphate kinase 3 isoform X1 n=1 Tax=Hippoglossus hippoglossus TaxID=8267 RepID=UPI00148D226A|nr:nucleoside diphosphate kinase 3 isoform X1 [Hippoglossus hippoglossus]
MCFSSRGREMIHRLINSSCWGPWDLIGCCRSSSAMGPKKRSQGNLSEAEDLMVKRARIEESAWTGVNERTFIAVKPDGVQRKLVGEIVRRFEKKGFKLVGLKLMQASEELLREHYSELRSKPFFRGLITYMSSGPVVAMVWQGLDVAKTARKMLGETNPADSMPGTIRGDYCVEVSRNVIHGSDSVASAQKEIALWFRQNELHCWEDNCSHWIYN